MHLTAPLGPPEGRMQYAPTAYRQEALFLMVDWWGSKNVTGKTCFLGSSFLLLIEEKKQKKIKASAEAGEVGRVRDESET